MTSYQTTTFDSLPVGQKFWLTNSKRNELYGPYTKREAVQCEESAQFYASHNCRFDGWNATRPDWNGDRYVDGWWSLEPETECVVPESRDRMRPSLTSGPTGLTK